MYDSGSTDHVWRIEKRSRTDGQLVNGFGTNGVIVSSSTVTTESVANAIAIDGSYMYVAGYDNVASGLEWRIEKRSLSTGDLDTTFATNGVYTNPFNTANDTWDDIRAIAVDDTYIYVSGYESTTSASPSSDRRWRIEKIIK